MSSHHSYSFNTVTSMNYSSIWNDCITIPEKSRQDNYNLHATGDADLNGRKYVALPAGTNTNDPRIREKYNLI